MIEDQCVECVRLRDALTYYSSNDIITLGMVYENHIMIQMFCETIKNKVNL